MAETSSFQNGQYWCSWVALSPNLGLGAIVGTSRWEVKLVRNTMSRVRTIGSCQEYYWRNESLIDGSGHRNGRHEQPRLFTLL